LACVEMMEGGREGRREGGKEGRREGGKEGPKEESVDREVRGESVKKKTK
jgi:hypothetical protein